MLYGNLIFIKKSGEDGSKFPVTQRDIKIGRSENCLIRIYNPQVASEHCQLIIEASGRAFLRNLSKQTIVNSKELGLEDVVLSHGDIFKVGERLARWEYLPTSNYYTQVVSPTKCLAAVVMPQQRVHETENTAETSASHVSVLKKTATGKKKLSENATLASSSIVKIKKSGLDFAQKYKNDVSKFTNGCQSLKATKLVLTEAIGRQSHSGVIGLKTKKYAKNKPKRSLMPSWKVNIVSPGAKKTTACRVSIKESDNKSSKSINNTVKTPPENIASRISKNSIVAPDRAIKTPQKTDIKSKSEEIIKSTSKRILKTPSKGTMESPSKISKSFSVSTSKYKSPSPKKNTLRTPSKLSLSIPKQKSKNFENLVHIENKILPLTGKRSSLPKGASGLSLILEKANSDSWQNSRRELLDMPKKSKSVLPEKIMLTSLKNLDSEELLFKKGAQTELKSLQNPILRNGLELKKTQRSSLKKIPRSPVEVKVKTPKKSFKTYFRSQKRTPVEVSNQSALKISTEMPAVDIDDLSPLKKKPRKSNSIKNTPIKKTEKLVRTSEKSISPSRRMSKKNTSALSPADITPKTAISPVKFSAFKKSQKTKFSPKKSTSLLQSRSTSTRGMRRKLSPSTSAERAAKKLKTSCPKKPDKNKKAALLVLGIANRNRLLSQNVKVLLKKAIKQSNAVSARKISAGLQKTAKSKNVSRVKSVQAKTKKLSKKNLSNEKISLRKLSQTSSDSVPKSYKIAKGNQQSAFKILEALVRSPEEKVGETVVATPPKQIKKSESPRSIVIRKSLNTATPTSFNKNAENYLFNTNRRCSKRLSSKNDTGRPDFIELSPTALGLIPKNVEVFKTPKVVERRSSILNTPKNVRTSRIIKSASTSKISNRKMRFSSKDLSFNLEVSSPNVTGKTDFDFSSFRTSDITMDVFVSPLTDETTKDLEISKANIMTRGNSKSVTKGYSGNSSPKENEEDIRGIPQSPQRNKSIDKILSNVTVTQSTDAASSPLRNLEKKSTVHENENPENDFSNSEGVFQVFATPKTQNSYKNCLSNPKSASRLIKTSSQLKSPKNDLSDLRGVKRLLRTPRLQKSPKNDLSDLRGVKRLLRTPRQQKSPRNDLSDLRGVKRLLRTPRQQKSPKNDLSDLRGVKRLLRTPRQQKSPKNDLSDLRGVKRLLRTPRQQKSPRNDLSDLRGVKRLLRTPRLQKSPKNDLSDLRGVKRLLRTPRQQKSPKNDLSDLRGVKRLLRTPRQQKSPKNDLSDLRGVKRLLRTPRQQKSPRNDLSDLRGVKRLLRTPRQQKSPKNDLSDVKGVKRLLRTPRQQKSPRNDLSDLRGVKRLLRTPRQQKSPKNDLSDVRGVKRLLRTPRQQKSPRNDLSDVRGVKRLLKAPRQQKSPKNDLTYLRGTRKMLQTPEVYKNSKNILLNNSKCDHLFESHDSEKLALSSAGVAKKINRTSESKENLNEILSNEISELLISKSNERLSKNKKVVPRKTYNKGFKSARGKRIISSKLKDTKNDLSDLMGVRELFSINKPVNDLNVDMTGIAELFDLPEFKDVSKQRVMKSSRKSKTITSQLKKLPEAEGREVRAMTRSRLKIALANEIKKEFTKKKKIGTSSKVETELVEKKGVKRKTGEKLKARRVKKSSASVNEKLSGIRSKLSEKVGFSIKSPKQGEKSGKRKIQFDESKMSPPKQSRKLTATEHSLPTLLEDNSKKAVSEVPKSKPQVTFKDEVPVKRGRKGVANKKDKLQKASSEIQSSTATNGGIKQIQGVKSKRSQSILKRNVSDSEIKISPRKTRSAKTKTLNVASSKALSKDVTKNIVKASIARRKKDTTMSLR